MKLTKTGYKKRLIDYKIEKYLKSFGAILIEGPKWCGKTWTALNHSNSVVFLDNPKSREEALLEHDLILNGKEYPLLIDEWQNVPELWDTIRHKCDEDHIKGKFILTGSSNIDRKNNKNIFHTGIGRIIPLKMYTMSLYESNHSSGDISILDMYENKKIVKNLKEIKLEELAKLIINGGWPSLPLDGDNGLTARKYYESILKTEIDILDINEYKKNSAFAKSLLKSLARNESSNVKLETILKDIKENTINPNDIIKERKTLIKYMNVLEKIFVLTEQEPFSLNYRSSSKISKTSKKHLIDPSLSCAALNLTVEKLMKDLNTFGLMFEALVDRDLRIYSDYLDAQIYHFRDNSSGDEVDTIIEFEDGSYAAFEIKLGKNQIEEAKKNLIRFYNTVSIKPRFMCIIVGNCNYIIKDKETGIYILPITSLKP